jgi:hypothetical protein
VSDGACPSGGSLDGDVDADAAEGARVRVRMRWKEKGVKKERKDAGV